MNSKQMMKTTAKPGYIWNNIAPLGEKPDWIEAVEIPNNDGKLFGYDEKEFLAKQYK